VLEILKLRNHNPNSPNPGLLLDFQHFNLNIKTTQYFNKKSKRTKLKHFPDTDTAFMEFTDKEVYETVEIDKKEGLKNPIRRKLI